MKKLAIAAVLISLLTPLTSLAAAQQQDMEHMSVTYRTPLEYAIYQYTTDLLNSFKLQLRADIHLQARMNIQQMYQEQSFTDNTLNADQQETIPVRLTGATTSAE
ncbi:hypothetical protein JK628_17240 [Shewanella sp. KX20019]|uniref:hypothetical protein n=1 Tax=Shewanella sp. KX20019 TaxID=2803864 RepID=UPI0019254FD2|nr:hypothetical protein [Shewanella sp. KX20019]QQX79273.1 hypothetical protein JK628_17240 [Shewanella sp. KX20019]